MICWNTLSPQFLLMVSNANKASSCTLGFLLPRRFFSIFNASLACLHHHPERKRNSMCIYATKIRQFVNPPCIKECKITGCFKLWKGQNAQWSGGESIWRTDQWILDNAITTPQSGEVMNKFKLWLHQSAIIQIKTLGIPTLVSQPLAYGRLLQANISKCKELTNSGLPYKINK